ncbi:hypothetical protein HPL003_21620 [Paenibacillus terrae HPL-003]|uniref:Uncharacterized protein n=1 Tax=Paenibacillus terrae (strain HPL-003) TaxID=985665 RepID=G7VPQ4_PAETH|nr:hypothetical protein HPL003_21620 [Paenibacillus terrae HPL-003]
MGRPELLSKVVARGAKVGHCYGYRNCGDKRLDIFLTKEVEENQMTIVDLHCHTKISDNSFTNEKVISFNDTHFMTGLVLELPFFFKGCPLRCMHLALQGDGLTATTMRLKSRLIGGFFVLTI